MARELQTNCNSRLIHFQYLIYHKVPISSELLAVADVPVVVRCVVFAIRHILLSGFVIMSGRKILD